MNEVSHKRPNRRPSFSPTPTISKRQRTPLASIENSTNSRQQSRNLRSKSPFRGTSKILPFNYSQEVFNYLIFRQIPGEPLSEFFQSGISSQMRSKIVDWMFLIFSRYQTNKNVIYTAVSILDRTLKYISIDKENLQLLGATSLFLSYKLHAPKTIPLKKIVEECGEVYTNLDIIDFESKILDILNFELNIPTVVDFIELYEPSLNNYKSLHLLIWFLSDIHLLFSSFLRFKSSTISNSIFIYSLNCLGDSICQPFIKNIIINEDWKELYLCIEEIHKILICIINKTKYCTLEKIQPENFKKIKELIGTPTLPSIPTYLSLFPQIDLD